MEKGEKRERTDRFQRGGFSEAQNVSFYGTPW